MWHSFQNYCKEYENIENYEKALAANFKGWHCHHRLETHTSDGERRPVDITQAELKALNMYYNRPPEELIFLTTREHNAFNKGKKRSEETRRKLSTINEGEKNPMYGKPAWNKGKKMSAETRKKMSEAAKGKKLSVEHKKKLSEVNKGNKYSLGMHWYNNGKENRYCYECPDGFVPGMLR